MEDGVGVGIEGGTGAGPGGMALVDEEYLLADVAHGGHVVGVDDGGDAVLVGDVADEAVDDARRDGVETRVGLVAEEVARLQSDGAGDGNALLHATTELGGHLLLCIDETHAVEAEAGTVELLARALRGEHLEGEEDVAKHVHGVEQGGALKEHAHLLAELGAFTLGQLVYVAPVVEHLALVGGEQTYDAAKQHGFARTATADDEVGLALLETGSDAVQHVLLVEMLVYVGDGDHFCLVFSV